MALLYAFGYTKLSFYVNFARLFVFRIPILLFFQHCTTLAGGQAMGLVMMISNGMTGLLALVVAAAVLHKEYGAGLDEATTQYLNESDAKVECSTEERR